MRVIAAQGPVRLSLRSIEQGRTEIPSLTVAISQPAGAASVWSLRIEPRFDAQGIVRELGRIETSPPSWGTPASKIVAIATAPGAVDWFVQVERVRIDRAQSVANDDDVLEVDLSASQDCTAPGLYVASGVAQVVGARYRYQAGPIGAGASQINVPAGYSVQTVSAYQVGAGGSMAVDGGDSLPLPTDGAVQFGPQGTLLGPTIVTFAGFPVGGGGYLIESLA
ncbi:MAG: hypothetical protein A2Y74_05335 [Actinobacteria bacterium RBG_13_63_9]|nr:MAG: hypothetical protein A2Y74_05335 [Actinobacteria bacterium RBG_13_63_9]